MEVDYNTNKEKWNNFIKQEHSRFLQSYEWQELNEQEGKKVFRLTLKKDKQIQSTALLIKKRIILNYNYLYCPHGPIIKNIGEEPVKKIFKELFSLGKKEKCIFIRFEPFFKISDFRFKIHKTIDVQPSKSLILDLSQSEEELLKAMRQKTRYNIRLAERKGVKIIEGKPEHFEQFWQIMRETIARDKFRLHEKKHYQKLLTINPNVIKLFLAEYKSKIIAANIVSFFGDTATYIHGASANMHRNVMAPYALQWQVIKLAKKKAFKYYDFYGIDENKWPGVTRFKLGFGGKKINYPGTFDLIVNTKMYFVYKLLRKIKRFI